MGQGQGWSLGVSQAPLPLEAVLAKAAPSPPSEGLRVSAPDRGGVMGRPCVFHKCHLIYSRSAF